MKDMHRHYRTHVPALLLSLLLTSLSSIAQASTTLYKWVDGKGEVHFSQKAPEGTRSTQMELKLPPVPKPPATEPAQQPAPDKNSPPEENAPAKKTRRTPQQIEADRINCAAARKNLELYRTAGRVREPNGDIVGLTDAMRQKKLAATQKQIDKYCR